MATATPKPSLLVLGYVFFELYWPEPERMPEPGEELFLPDIPVGLGGAANAASVAQSLGLEVTLAFPKGNGLCDMALEGYLQNRLGLSLLTWPAQDNTAITLIMNERSDRCFLSKADTKAFSQVPSLPVKDVVLVGLHEMATMGDALQSMQQQGSRLCLSGGFQPELLQTLGDDPRFRFDLVFLNEGEADMAAPGWRERPQAFHRFTKDALVTLGKDGAMGYVDGQTYRVSAPAVEVVDTTGAGDAFTGAFISQWAQGRELEASMQTACAVASRMVGVRGGVVPDSDFLREFREA